MRILVLIHEFPPIGGGGGSVALDLAASLTRRGHDVEVLAPYFAGLALQAEIESVRVTRLPSLRRNRQVADLPAMAGYLAVGSIIALWKILRRRPNVIHVHFAVPAGALAWWLSKLTGVPYVLTTHLGDIPGGVPEKTDRWFAWVRPLTPRIWRDAARVTAVSRATQQLAANSYDVPIRVVPNGIVVAKYSPVAGLREHDPPVIAFAGRFVAQKNPIGFLRALSRLKDLDWRCLMMGDGPLRPDMLREAGALGIADRLALTGWLDQEALARRLGESEILLMPSLSEGLPIVGLQALAAGLAIVASRVGGFPDIVEEGANGFLCEPADIGGFASRLRTLLTDPSLRLSMRTASLEKAAAFDLQEITDQYERVFEEAVGARGERGRRS